jgi:hypothetical protein
MTSDLATTRSRRSVLRLALGSAVGAVAGVLGWPAATRAADGGNVILGQANDATATTTITNPTASFSAVWGNSSATTGTGVGVRGDTASTGGSGVWGNATGDGGGYGVHGTGPSAGVFGESPGAFGVQGSSTDGYGVFGGGGIGGVEGSGGQFGVLGASAGIGVKGQSSTGTGVDATSISGAALSVHGKLKLSRSGRASVSAGHSKVVVTMTGVTSSSYIIATPQTNRPGLFVQAVVAGSGKFTIYLYKVVSGTTRIGYIVVN